MQGSGEGKRFMADATGSASGGGKDASFLTFPPIVYLILGVILFIAWLAGNSMQIQTNEAWVLSHGVGVLHPDLMIWRQIGNIWSGNMTVGTSIAFIYGWGVQLILLTCKIGIERAQSYIHKKYGSGSSERSLKAASVRGGIWTTLSWFIVLLDRDRKSVV